MKTIKLDTLIENPDNPQTVTDEAFADLCKSIERDEARLELRPIAFVTDYETADGTSLAGKRVVIDGNKRLRALKKIRGDSAALPAKYFYDMTSCSLEERKRWLVRANIQSGEWDAEALAKLYTADELADITNDKTLAELLANAEADETEGKTDADDIPEVNTSEPPKSVRGEIYQLGNHRLMCGDATSADDVAHLVQGGGIADMIYTDPPYNVSIGARNAAINREEKKHGQKNLGGRVERPIEGDQGWSDEECGEKLWKPAFINMANAAADHCCIYVSMPQGGTHMMMMMMMMRDSWQVKHELMWLKDQPTFSMGRLDYDYKHEPICYGWKKTHRFYGKGDFTKSVWEFPKPRSSKDHPTMKPVDLVCNAILNSSQSGENVLDLFGGSGTTLIACEKTHRNCRMMELDPHYCDVIRRRWAEFVNGEGCDWESLTPAIENPETIKP